MVKTKIIKSRQLYEWKPYYFPYMNKLSHAINQMCSFPGIKLQE